MALLDIVLRVLVVAASFNGIAALFVLGPARLSGAVQTVHSNVRAVWPSLGLLLVFLGANSVIRDLGAELSWLIGLNITGYISAIEGEFVALLQSVASPTLTAYFSFVYVYGYVFLLTFPFVAYAVYDDPKPLRAIIVAYGLNYAVGLVCYVVFVAYGPRNFMPEMVEPLLYTNWPQSQLLTSEVNVNTNVFPSLHTSLSVTVALLAYRYHSIHERWTPVAWLLATSIAVSTLYLGIHWATDVIAGIGLAVGSVAVATRTAGTSTLIERLRSRWLSRS